MTVYIEYVIIDNFFVTLLISLLSYRVLSVKASKLRALAAAVVGTAAAVVYPLLNIHPILLILFKFFLAVILSLILFYKRCRVYKGMAAFVLMTVLFGGIMFLIGFMVYSDPKKALTLPVTSLPVGFIIAAAMALYPVLKIPLMKFKRISDAKNYVADTEIDIFSKTVKGKGFIDTGNRLYDEKSGLPVVVLNIKAALNVLDAEKLKAVLSGSGEKAQEGAHYIDYCGVGAKKNKILVLKPDELRLYSEKREHRIKDVMIGLAFSKFSDAVDYDVILHPAII